MKQMPHAWSQYGKKVTDHFKNPCDIGEMEGPNGVGHVGNPVCGDIVKLYTRIEDSMIVREHLESECRLTV